MRTGKRDPMSIPSAGKVGAEDRGLYYK